MEKKRQSFKMYLQLVGVVCVLVSVRCVFGFYDYGNRTLDPASRQLWEYKVNLPKPIRYTTLTSGSPVELRDIIGTNTDIFSNAAFWDQMSNFNEERIPERIVHAKGSGALGHFEVTHDVSKYTCADVFNGIGKKTPVAVRFSLSAQNLGGSDLAREMRGFAVKFYTRDGNLDLLAINYPVYFYKDPMDFTMFAHAMKRNPKTNLFDNSARLDFVTLRPSTLHGFMWMLSDYGIPDGYRRMEGFSNHAFLINNKEGDKYYVRFNLKPKLGFANLTTAQAVAIGATDMDYFTRDLYNAIEEKNYPTWRLEMDVLSTPLENLDYDPFDVTRLWKNGTYHTVTVGQLVLNKNPENIFEAIEQLSFNPSNLVPGIPGPVDLMFQTRRFAYRATQNYRLGVNHNKIEVNRPKYINTYSRDGKAPVGDNMKDTPNYYPNSFNGPEPYVNANRPAEKMLIYESNAVDFEPSSYFYNKILTDEGQRQRLADNFALMLRTVYPPQLVKRVLQMLTLVDPDLGKKTANALKIDRESSATKTDEKTEQSNDRKKKRLKNQDN